VESKKFSNSTQSNKKNNQNLKSKRQDNYTKKGDTNYRTTWSSLKIGKIRCSGRESISCSTCGTPHHVPYVVSRNETKHFLNVDISLVSMKS